MVDRIPFVPPLDSKYYGNLNYKEDILLKCHFGNNFRFFNESRKKGHIQSHINFPYLRLLDNCKEMSFPLKNKGHLAIFN